MKFGSTRLGLVVAPAKTHAIDVAPVRLLLGVFERVAVHLAGARQQILGAVRLGETERVVGAQRADLERRDRVFEVIDRAGRAGEVQHDVEFVLHPERGRDVVPDELELRVGAEVVEVRQVAGDHVIDGDDVVPFGQEPLAEVRADEPGSAGDEGAHARLLLLM